LSRYCLLNRLTLSNISISIALLTLSTFSQADCHQDNTQVITEYIDRMAVTSDIQNREPVDALCESNNSALYFFTDLRQLKGKTIRHQWIHEDLVESEKVFEVGGDRWRVWSKKALDESVEGLWILAVLDEDNNLLAVKRFKYSP